MVLDFSVEAEVARRADPVSVGVPFVAVFVAVLGVDLPCGFGGRNRPVAGHSGCTYHHLPISDRPLGPMTEEAIFAILAARMAFSRRWIRSPDR